MLKRPVAAVVAALMGFSALSVSASSAEALGRSHPPVLVAHRGASSYAPENTLAAVDEARDRHLPWVENDVQRTRDGKLVVIHDTTLGRTTDAEDRYPDRAPWNVSDFTLREIKRLDAGGWFSAEYRGERVPTLTEYLRTITRNGQNLLLEIKSPELYPGIEQQILDELRAGGWLDRDHVRNRLIIQSFSADSVRTVHQLRPDVKTGFLGTPAVAELADYARFTDQINPSHTTIDADYVKAVHRFRGPHHAPLEVYTWTVDDGPTARSLARYGVDGIISNSADVVRAALRGHHPDTESPTEALLPAGR
ncbi:glycerophosphodiester phosphodiesterase [Streptomyces sp. TP-A0874]|uniref:glycerophosphodiester phosphodiesterase n=1 Tax=Streptomyces sp. TP-A0874 TaxID=549819 RepID=UPI000B23389B|nr:glycerophosphodiester phosphodiesterase family protein [Streptomyces sp. TP-A0874]